MGSCPECQGCLHDVRLGRLQGDELGLKECARLCNGWGRTTQSEVTAKAGDKRAAGWGRRHVEVLCKLKTGWLWYSS